MFLQDREEILASIYIMGATCCSYSHGGHWSDRCDCKYGVTLEGGWPTAHEGGNGCPELRAVYEQLRALSDDEWARLARRGGSVGLVLSGPTILQRLQRAEAAAAMAASNIQEVREALSE